MAKPSTSIEAIVHISRDGERWDMLAWTYYGNPHAYSRIIEANPDIDITDVLPSGLRVLIPVLTEAQSQATVSSDNLPPWKR